MSDFGTPAVSSGATAINGPGALFVTWVNGVHPRARTAHTTCEMVLTSRCSDRVFAVTMHMCSNDCEWTLKHSEAEEFPPLQDMLSVHQVFFSVDFCSAIG